MGFRCLVGLASLSLLGVAVAALPQSRHDVRLTASPVAGTSQDSVYIAARATNTGLQTLRLEGGINFNLEYRPSAWSESIMSVRRDSFLQANGDIHVRCGELSFPSPRRWSPYSRSLAVVTLGPGESLADTFVFAQRLAAFKSWPGRLIVKCALWIETGRNEEPYVVYEPEDAWVSIPVP